MEIICTNCDKECRAIAETIDYPGTHCNYGRSGTAETGEYYSDCCHAEIEIKD